LQLKYFFDGSIWTAPNIIDNVSNVGCFKPGKRGKGVKPSDTEAKGDFGIEFAIMMFEGIDLIANVTVRRL